MKNLLLILSILLLFSSVSAQEITNTSEFVPLSFSSNFFTTIPKLKTPPKGSVYLNENYTKGMIIVNDTSYIKDVKLNFNFYTDKIEVYQNDTIYNIDPYLVKWFTLNGSNFGMYTTPGPLKKYNEFKDCNLVKLYYKENNTVLLEKYYLKLLKSNYNTAVDAGETSDTYVVYSKLYLVKDNNVYKFSKRKSSILNIFADQKDSLKTFVKDNNLKYNKLSDIIKIIAYYDSLSTK